MITKNEAIEKVKSSLDEDFDIMQDAIIEKKYGWLIFAQTKDYIRTKNPIYSVIGSGGTLVEKATGRCIEFGSAYSTEENLEIYERGYLKYDNWDLVVLKAKEVEKTLDYLQRLDLTYVIPEGEFGEVWRIPKKYTRQELRRKLSTLPVVFNIGSCYFRWDVLESYRQQHAFSYELKENKGYQNSI